MTETTARPPHAPQVPPARLLALHAGLPRTRKDDAGVWTSGIFKDPVHRPVWLDRLNLEGDRQADLTVHGGPDKAVLFYSAEHYGAWRHELGLYSFELGAFGENFSVSVLTESTVCLGDRYRIGEALVDVSQPRQPCWKLARRWQRPDLPARVVRSGRSGWYARVDAPGTVTPGSLVELVERPFPEWTIAVVNQVAYSKGRERTAAGVLADLPALSASWRGMMRRLASGETLDD